jgi:HK97 family phage major capsid protein
MASRDFSAWVPVIWDDQVTQREVQASAIYDAARIMNMVSNTYEIPRFTGANVSGGSALTEDTNSGDVANLYSYQFNGKMTLDEAQIEDSPADEVASVTYEWLNSFHISYDNACIGVSAARSTTASNFQPFESVYYKVRHSDSDVGYTADDNYTSIVSGGLTYDGLNTALGKVESTKFWNPVNACAILHPSMKKGIRGIKNTQGSPIFVESSAGMAGGGVRPQYELFGLPVYWSFGAQVSTNFQMTTVGNPLVIFANRRHLVRGDRIGPQAQFINANININALEHTVQFRARQGFCATVPNAMSVLEVGA